MRQATVDVPYYKAKTEELEFISRIKRDGTGVELVDKAPVGIDQWWVNRLSISEGTWIAHGFNSYVVKIND